jgi:nucleotide-binding universal stress UspA family protein
VVALGRLVFAGTALQMEDDAPYRAIIHVAEDHCCNLIVMASHGRGGVSALLLGSETMKVLHHSNILVLVVR